ncbi:uncharacterized protein LOC122253040 [Penaeus japonicus]|uniref:uncharacterized protein LOC122253040 n=1 Tax=Penaeus japonicus TaxID=27405 RepID=UPI001C710400|nr:uncharacterized protein LOC122253040 [Penaeus japonicus]
MSHKRCRARSSSRKVDATGVTTRSSACTQQDSAVSLSSTSGEEFAAQPSTSGIPSTPQPSTSRRSTITKNRKMYDIAGPFSDPELERRRINAVTAKENRDRKKRDNDSLREQVRSLTFVNGQAAKALKQLDADVQKLSAKMKTLEQHNLSLQEEIKQKAMEIHGHHKRFVFFREHLDLIFSSLGDENPAKKLIANLLKSPSIELAAIPKARPSNM